MRKVFLAGACLLSVMALSIGCGKTEQPQEQEVLVNGMKVEKVDAPLDIQYPAQISGSLEIDVRAQVGGILKSRNYTEGAYVEKGTLLFVIDPQPYQVALEKAKGNLAQVESDVKRTKREYDRMARLFKQNAVSAKENDDALSAYEKAQANFVVAKAGVEDAAINLGYTSVSAPISGITGREAQSVGSLISPTSAQSSLLTTMVQTNPLYVNFSVPSQQWNASSKTKEAGKIDVGVNDVGVQIIMQDGSVYPQLGKIFFVDSAEDVKTASIAIKAEVPNPNMDNTLLPGKFVKVKLTNIIFKDAIIIPATAIASSSAGDSVYVVNNEGIIEARPVKVTLQGSTAFVNSGLEAGETIIVEGLVKIRPGQKVKVNYINAVAPEADEVAPSIAPEEEATAQPADDMAPSVAPEAAN